MTLDQFLQTNQQILSIHSLVGSLMLFSLIILGVLISRSNRRVEGAIQEANQQLRRWSAQDLRIKRGQAARQIRIDDPSAWFRALVARVTGEAPQLVQVKAHQAEGRSALVATAQDGQRWLLAAASPRQLKPGRRGWPWRSSAGRLAAADQDPLFALCQKAIAVNELSILNAGLFFDLEAQTVWEAELGESLTGEVLFLYALPGREA